MTYIVKLLYYIQYLMIRLTVFLCQKIQWLCDLISNINENGLVYKVQECVTMDWRKRFLWYILLSQLGLRVLDYQCKQYFQNNPCSITRFSRQRKDIKKQHRNHFLIINPSIIVALYIVVIIQQDHWIILCITKTAERWWGTYIFTMYIRSNIYFWIPIISGSYIWISYFEQYLWK